METEKTVKAVKAAKRLIKYCNKHNCNNCIFLTCIEGELYCALNYPYKWREIKGVNDEIFNN